MREIAKNRRVYSLLAAVFVTAVLFFCVFFLVTHTEHDCTGEGCPVCAQLDACTFVVHSVGGALCAGAAVIALRFVSKTVLLLADSGRKLCPASLVSLKIRLDN